MTDPMNQDWPYPGSRWRKFDFHTHTPASADTPWAKRNLALSFEDWLLKYMAAGVDCVAVTDHNSGAWIDGLKAAYGQMKQQAAEGTPPDGFRELTLFPGVEISVNGGFHLLAIFDPSATARTISDLLATVRYQDTDGDSDGVTRASPADVVQAVLDANGIPIPAHSDQDKGLLRVNPGTRECALDPYTVRQVMDIEGLLAVEWLDTALPVPACVEKESERVAKVLGSDCHSFQGSGVPGSRFTWIKMASSTLGGLRLALLDGNGVSVRRSDEGAFEPFQTPTHFVTGIKIDSARFMGNGAPERLFFTPYYNALIGGRGTGKSTVVHAMRMAYRRDEELRRLGEKTEPYRQFTGFAEPVERFVSTTLAANNFVRMKVIGFGFEERSIERSLRSLLDVQDERFENDILRFCGGEPAGGLAMELAVADDCDVVLQDIKRRLIATDKGFGGHFRNYIQRKLETPEFADHVRCWFPDDDLRIEYSRGGDGRDWSAITQGSQGQRSAALLAFLLAFGDEPLILDQPEDDLDNHLIYELIVRQIRENKRRRQLIIVKHNPNVVVNGDAEMVHAFDFGGGQCRVMERGALQEKAVREEVCRVMEGGREAFSRRWARLGREV